MRVEGFKIPVQEAKLKRLHLYDVFRISYFPWVSMGSCRGNGERQSRFLEVNLKQLTCQIRAEGL